MRTPSGGIAGPTPGELTGMVVWFSVDGSLATAVDNHTPGTPYHMVDTVDTQVLTNLAPGGPTLSWTSASPSDRPYYHTANWVLTGEPVTVPMPNGHPFISTNNGDDTGLVNNIDSMSVDLSAPTTTQAGYSGITVIHFVQDSPVARRLWHDATYVLDAIVNFDEDERVGMKDSLGVQTLGGYKADAWEDEWVVLTWTHDGVTGAEAAYNGNRITPDATATGNMYFDTMFQGNSLTTGMTESILYESANTMASLDVVGAQFATKYGITYTAP